MNFINSEKYADRDGNTYQFIGAIKGLAYFLDTNNHEIITRHSDGSYLPSRTINSLDIITHIPTPIKRTVFIHCYADKDFDDVYRSKEQSDKNRMSSILAIKEITYEFTEGEGLE